VALPPRVRRLMFAPSLLLPLVVLTATPSSSSSPSPSPSPLTSPSRSSSSLLPDLHNAVGLGVRYEIKDGALWWARDGEPLALFGDGFPPEHQIPVVAVVADEADHFLTVTEDGLLHHHDDKHWDTLWGLPPLRSRRTILRLPVPVSALRPGRIAYSQRHKNVGFYEDVVGSQFHWGIAGCTSVYVLSEDGAHLLFADPWIPADFSRELMLPVVDGELVVAESVAASASTVVVIDGGGGVFVRFDDYDHNGGTPFYHYSYQATSPQPLRGDDPASELQVRALPGFGWQRLPDVVLGGAARLSRRIAVTQTGVGNSARVVVVAGDNADGVRGVYEYDMRAPAPAWRFVAEDPHPQPLSQRERGAGLDVASVRRVVVDADDWLTPGAAKRVKKPALAYDGRATGPVADAVGLVAIKTDDFWFHDGRFTLTMMVGEYDVPVSVDVVDAWTLFQNENAATSLGGVKSLKATLRLIQPEGPVAVPAQAQAQVQALLGDVLDVPFGAVVVASQDRLILAPVSYPYNLDGVSWRMELMRRATPDFTPRRQRRFVVDDEDYAVLSREAQLAGVLEATLPAATSMADVLSVVTSARWTLRETYWLTGFEGHMPAALAAQRISADLKLRSAVRGRR